ncbi:MAG: YdeI/OmpD-associated family protein [Flavobacteriaceae bacterium]|nr:YdeI/OmpD-associated family protein [Flavobacteriaceae bacterium]
MEQSPVFEVVVSGTHSLAIPEAIARPFYEKGMKRVLVEARYGDRSLRIHAALNRWKNGTYSIMFSKNNQKQLGIFPNDYFQMQFFEDTSKYGVELPEEFEAVLFSDPEAHRIFEGFTPGKKRGIIYMIAKFKASQKRIDKTLLLCENLKRGLRDNKELLRPL